jgi:2',3'-cyclic-nucleotide 2'-phosphodiesterase (5'-nucleotidase family)
MFYRLLILIFIGAGLTACSFALNKKISSEKIVVITTENNNNSIDSIVKPYKSELQEEMSQKIAFAEVDFINERYNGNLGSLVADIFLEKGKELEGLKNTKSEIICVINFGGLRASINKGNVLLSDVYKLLPFDNYLVAVKMKKSALNDLKTWLIKSGGHPIAGLTIDKNLFFNSKKEEISVSDDAGVIWIITNDYLLNGGDNASFFRTNLEVIQTNFLLRDVFLEKIKDKNLKDIQEKRVILE